MARIRVTDKLSEHREAYAQFALVYTTPSGDRRIRVSTLGLQTSATAGIVFRGADLDAQLCALAATATAEARLHSYLLCHTSEGTNPSLCSG